MRRRSINLGPKNYFFKRKNWFPLVTVTVTLLLVPITVTEFVTVAQVIGAVRLGMPSRLKPVAALGQERTTDVALADAIFKVGIATGTGVTSAQVKPTRTSSA